MMIRMFLSVLVLGVAMVSAKAADGFVAGFEDLPLMAGLSMSEDDAMSFDSPTGRIVDATAKGAVAGEAVRLFYNETLPQLGWRKGTDGHYHREGETLAIETESTPAGLAVRFYMTPSSAQ